MAHYNALADFLSRAVNRRDDQYGRTLEGRARLALEIVAGIRERVGPDYPISCRFSADEFVMGGNTLNETIPLARMLVGAGATMLSVSAGGRMREGGEYSYYRAYPMHDWPDALNTYLAEEIKRTVHVPVRILISHESQAVSRGYIHETYCSFSHDCAYQGLQHHSDFLDLIATSSSCIHMS